jgi:hypothetical protein
VTPILVVASAVLLSLATCGVAVAVQRAAGSGKAAASALAASGQVQVSRFADRPSIWCGDDGISGRRVQLVYVQDETQERRYDEYVDRFREMARKIDAAFVEAGRRTGGVRHVRFVSDGSCRPVIDHVVIGSAQIADSDLMIAALQVKGYDRTDRKYVVWYDHPGCGLAYGSAFDDRPGPGNSHNGGPGYATVGTECWTWHATAHELLHTLGAVQRSAPHATANSHCWDDEDIMCYDDGSIPDPPGRLRVTCPHAPENHIDCNGDDYFNVSAPAGSYLATHWNVANSLFLGGAPVSRNLRENPSALVQQRDPVPRY